MISSATIKEVMAEVAKKRGYVMNVLEEDSMELDQPVIHDGELELIDYEPTPTEEPNQAFSD